MQEPEKGETRIHARLLHDAEDEEEKHQPRKHEVGSAVYR